MVVVDTNVLAYLLIEGDHTRHAQRLYERDAEWTSEAFVFVEFSNILATYERAGLIDATQSERLLREAEGRVREAPRLPAVTALRFARRYAVSAYDARFLAVAESVGERLVTEDARLRAAAPMLSMSLEESLAAP